MLEPAGYIPINTVADTVRLALAPVFLLTAIGAFLNVCATRLSRIVDRSREIEPFLLGSRGREHDRWQGELQVLDRRMSMVSSAISFSVMSAVLTCLVVALLFAANFVETRLGVAIALLFIAATVAIAISFAIFLIETRLGARSVRVRGELLQHRVDDSD
jgi:MFS family permease